MTILKHITQLATCPSGNLQSDAGLVDNAAVVWDEGQIRWVGPYREMPLSYRGHEVTDAGGRLVVPGLVDCHTHLAFGGWRGDEFERRLAGASYLEIAASGGGIISTVSATRAASLGELLRKAEQCLDRMLLLGITTVECKSGYGLDEANEIKLLEVYRRLNAKHTIDLIPTFMGAHIVPLEYRDRRDAYVELICQRLLPEIARRKLAKFCDVFVEDSAFSLEEARRILDCAKSYGLGLKVHADQLTAGGGAALAAEMGAVSAEHLEHIEPRDIEKLARAGTVAVSLPLAAMYLGQPYLDARKMLAAGVRTAVATDFNPGTAPSYHLPLAMTLACLNQRMTPQEALMGATAVAARAIGLDAKVGSLLPGFQADLIIIDAPSLNHWLYHFRDNACVGVVKQGRQVYFER